MRAALSFAPRRRLLAALAGSVAVLTLGACRQGSPGFVNTDVTGAEFGRGFDLTDHHGQPRTLADFRGKAVIVFFGFTQCPDVCPTTLSEMAQAMVALGARADQVQVLFITLDPERDTRELLAQYVPAFDKRFLGLFGDAQATTRVAREFKVFFQKVPGSTPGSYTLDHTAGSYVFDPKGRLRLFVKHGQGPAALVGDLGRLLDGA
jgi:protein SCO1/2